MQKSKFKFNLGDRVFVIGNNGVSVVTGRGTMCFASGGVLNMYQINGAHFSIVPETVLLSFEEEKELMRESFY